MGDISKAARQRSGFPAQGPVLLLGSASGEMPRWALLNQVPGGTICGDQLQGFA
jgi:hypothetical protein